jgi:hypothetical protein
MAARQRLHHDDLQVIAEVIRCRRHAEKIDLASRGKRGPRAQRLERGRQEHRARSLGEHVHVAAHGAALRDEREDSERHQAHDRLPQPRRQRRARDRLAEGCADET